MSKNYARRVHRIRQICGSLKRQIKTIFYSLLTSIKNFCTGGNPELVAFSIKWLLLNK